MCRFSVPLLLRPRYQVQGYRLASRPDVATWWVVFTFAAVLVLVEGEEEVHLRRASGLKVSLMRQGLMRSNFATVKAISVDVDFAMAARDEG